MQSVEKLADPYREFLFALNSPVSKERYSTRLRWFFTFLRVQGTMEERCREFVDNAREQPRWAYESVIGFLQYEKDRCDRKEITGSTVRGYYKAVKLFMEVNDILIPWNKIKRGIPRGRRYADEHDFWTYFQPEEGDCWDYPPAR